MAIKSVLNELKEKFQEIVTHHKLGDKAVKVTIGTLSPKQAIGSPVRQDFPLLQGREVMIEAQVLGSYGQAFTDMPREYSGSLNDILNLPLDNSGNRAVFIAALNAVAAHLKLTTGTRHCRDEEPEECAKQIAEFILDDVGKVKIGLIGLQPAILENLVLTFGADNVRCTDLNPNNVGSKKYGAEIWDGRTETGRLIDWSDLLLVTASTINNNTFDEIREKSDNQGKRLIVFGVTGAGAASLLDLERVCFKPH